MRRTESHKTFDPSRIRSRLELRLERLHHKLLEPSPVSLLKWHGSISEKDLPCHCARSASISCVLTGRDYSNCFCLRRHHERCPAARNLPWRSGRWQGSHGRRGSTSQSCWSYWRRGEWEWICSTVSGSWSCHHMIRPITFDKASKGLIVLPSS